MPLDLPSVQSLNDMQFLPPGLNQIAGQNMGLQQQYSQGALQQQAADLQAKSLQNMFNEQNNPQLVQSQGLANQSAQNTNAISGVNARNATDLEPEQKAALRQKFLTSLDEDDLKSWMAKAEATSIKAVALGDDQLSERATKMMNAGRKELEERTKQAAAQENSRIIVGGRKDVAETNAGGRLSAEQLKASTALAIQGMKSEDNKAKLQAALNNPKVSMDNLLAGAIADASQETDPAKRADKLEYVNGIQNAIISQKQAMSGQQINVADAANMPKNVIPPVAVGNNPVGGRPALPAGAQSPVSMPVAQGPNGPIQQPNKEGVVDTLLREYQKPQTSEVDYQGIERELRAAGYRGQLPMKGKVAVPGATPNIPAGAAQMLKGNPALAAAFDQKYGPGSAKSILGQ